MARHDPLNVARYWQDPAIPGLSLMQADFRTQSYAPHRHEALVVAATEDGGSMIRSRGTVEQADAATLFVFNPVEPHSGWMGASRHWRYRALYLEQDALDTIAASLGLPGLPYFTRNTFPDRELQGRFVALHRALQEGRDALLQRELIVSTFGLLFRRYGGRDKPVAPRGLDRTRLDKVIAIMRARLDADLSLVELSEAVNLTQFQLIGLFKRATGLTPHAYLVQLRLDRACACLRRGMPIAEAALTSGFYDQSALTKHFKRTFGVTPLHYAQALNA
jgi:AraC-like DNA-binding protein